MLPDAAAPRLPLAAAYRALTAVTGLLLATAVTVAALSAGGSGTRPGPADLALAGLLVLTATQRLVLSRLDEELVEVTVASVFALALVLTAPLWFVLIAQALAAVVAGARRRHPARRLPAAAAQLALGGLASRAVFCLLTGRALLPEPTPLTPRDIAAALAAGFTLFLLHHALVGLDQALDRGLRPMRHLRAGLPVQVRTSGVLLPFAPVLVVAVQFSLAVLPLLLLPIGAVRRSAALAADREGLVARDPLTGLPNRSALQQRAAAALATPADGSGTAVVLIDLDHFKDINDTLGHEVGDRLLCAVADRLRGSLRDGDTVGRLGGDEFAVLARDLRPGDAERLARRVLDILQQPFTVDGVRLDAQASLGIALAPEHGSDAETLLQRADVALYTAKVHRGTYAVYAPEADRHSVERLAFLGELREGVAGGQLVVHYQPMCDAQSGELVALEALVRWRHPSRGLVYPDAFIPVAENTGLIRALTLEVLDQALATARRMRDAGTPLGISVNLSVRCLADPALPAEVAALLDRWAVPASTLTLEVTETSIMSDPARALLVLGELRELGVTLSIDDFGTGYCSLSYLTRLEAHELKIDRSFVFAMARNAQDAAIVRSTIELGHSLGLRLVAEGVEDADTWGMLRALGCDVVQGYHLSPPLAPADLSRWVQDYPGCVVGLPS